MAKKQITLDCDSGDCGNFVIVVPKDPIGPAIHEPLEILSHILEQYHGQVMNGSGQPLTKQQIAGLKRSAKAVAASGKFEPAAVIQIKRTTPTT